MKILKMKLENFQGVKELEIDPQGESSAIYGDNGTGKSTVYNAFTWLMYGKPSTTEKNYTPKTTGSHNLHHSVEMTVELADGSEMVLKKDYHEVYKTIKGNPQPVLSGHTTDYSMDGVPVSETQFKKNLLEIYHDEELAKMNYWTNLFNTEVGALDPDEAPLIIAALEELASTYKKTVPGAGNIADTFRKNTKSIVFMTKVPKGN